MPNGAFGGSSFEDVIYNEPVYTNFLVLIDGEMSGPIAETNAEGFQVENLEVNQVQYDSDKGSLTLTLCFQYSGDQMPEKPWCGNIFYFQETRLRLYWRAKEWQFDDYEAFEVLESDTDRERDYEQQRSEGML